MHSISFSCPHCAARLRIRDRSFVGTHVDCPDCGKPLLIVSDDAGQVAARSSDALATQAGGSLDPLSTGPVKGARKKVGAAVSTRPLARSESLLSLNDLSLAPDDADTKTATPHARSFQAAIEKLRGTSVTEHWAQVAAWGVAAVCILSLFAFYFFSGNRSIGRDPAQLVAPDATAMPAAPLPAPEADRAPAKSAAAAPGPSKAGEKEAPTPERRLTQLGEWLLADAHENGHFPSGSLPAEGIAAPELRFSWLAELESQLHPNGVVQPLWDRPWRDTLNDRFVRRSIPEFQNPRIKQLTGADGYPATHFVGMAGVGSDAPRLPVDHPRAGVFGNDRRTRLDDIRDGASQTILLAGVRNELGSWAAGGSATIRPFTREPYVNGPDGFGTGPPDRMFVLMADGSVREIAKAMDPGLVRQLATIADGLPQSNVVPGKADPTAKKPAEQTAQTDRKPIRPAEGSAEEKPVVPLPPPVPAKPEPQLDIPVLLGQKILRFEQPIPAPLLNLLLQVEEMSGVPIQYKRQDLGADAARLDVPISLHLKDVTVGEILQALLKRGGLGYRIERNRIQIVPLDKSSS